MSKNMISYLCAAGILVGFFIIVFNLNWYITLGAFIMVVATCIGGKAGGW